MTVRWGIVGCGDVVRKRVAAAIQEHPGSSLVAACRRNEEALRKFCAPFDGIRAYTRADDLLEDPDIDAVYIATPNHLHAEQTCRAAAAGKHVLVEKPMALTVADCDRMMAACRDADVRLGVAYYRAFYPVMDRMKELLEEGVIGRLISVGAFTASQFALNESDDGYWRVRADEGGGGPLMDIGCHRLERLLAFGGEVSDVKAVCSTQSASYAVEDSASVLMKFHSGVHGTLQCFFGAQPDPDELTLTGTKGRLIAAPLNQGRLTIWEGWTPRSEQLPCPANFNLPLIDDFVAAMREGRAPRIDGQIGRRVNAVMEAAYRDADVPFAAPASR